MNQALYNTIGTGYNNTRRADPYLTGRLYHHLSPANENQYLDIGCGTGNYTIELTGKGLNFTGIDPSLLMIHEARLRNQNIKWLSGSAEQLPFTSNSFDGAIATLTIHHWIDLPKAMVEINRVLSEHGRIVFFTSTPGQMKGYWLNHYFPKMMDASISQMPSLEKLTEAVTHAGFAIAGIEKYFVSDELQDHFLYSGKNRPELYFDKVIQAGISSFSALSNLEEVKKGLSNLKRDIENNTFHAIRNQYENDDGDYLFVVAEK